MALFTSSFAQPRVCSAKRRLGGWKPRRSAPEAADLQVRSHQSPGLHRCSHPVFPPRSGLGLSQLPLLSGPEWRVVPAGTPLRDEDLREREIELDLR